jgi:hypothetical protein
LRRIASRLDTDHGPGVDQGPGPEYKDTGACRVHTLRLALVGAQVGSSASSLLFPLHHHIGRTNAGNPPIVQEIRNIYMQGRTQKRTTVMRKGEEHDQYEQIG